MSKEEKFKCYYCAGIENIIVEDAINNETYLEDDIVKLLNQQDQKIADLEAKLAESEKKPNQYPYKNDVIEKQYEDLKDGIKFRIENNIIDDWEQLYHCIDVLCEKHKARIRDIENSICKIEKLEQQLAEKDKIIDWQSEIVEGVKQEEELLAQKLKSLGVDCIEDLGKEANQAKTDYAIAQLEKVKTQCEFSITFASDEQEQRLYDFIDQQIKELKEGK